MKDKEFYALILAAGKGTRMKSDLAKVLHSIEGKPLLYYVLEAARGAGAEKIVVIIGHQAQKIREQFSGSGFVFVEQKQQLGTGHAVLQARPELGDYQGLTVILCGDVPLLKPATIKNLIKDHIAAGACVTVLTTALPDPRGYGRILKNDDGNIIKIVEQNDATDAEKKITEINTGIYCVNTPFLFSALEKINNNNKQKEYYLTDIIEITCQAGRKVKAYLTKDYLEVMGINTSEELFRAGQYLKKNRK